MGIILEMRLRAGNQAKQCLKGVVRVRLLKLHVLLSSYYFVDFCILFCWLNLNIRNHHVIVELEIVFMLPLFGLCSGFFVSVLYQIYSI